MTPSSDEHARQRFVEIALQEVKDWADLSHFERVDEMPFYYRKNARLNAEIEAMEAQLDAEATRRRKAEADLAAERYVKQALLDTMTPGKRRGIA